MSCGVDIQVGVAAPRRGVGSTIPGGAGGQVQDRSGDARPGACGAHCGQRGSAAMSVSDDAACRVKARSSFRSSCWSWRCGPGRGECHRLGCTAGAEHGDGRGSQSLTRRPARSAPAASCGCSHGGIAPPGRHAGGGPAAARPLVVIRSSDRPHQRWDRSATGPRNATGSHRHTTRSRAGQPARRNCARNVELVSGRYKGLWLFM